jgi:hypothetical protein
MHEDTRGRIPTTDRTADDAFAGVYGTADGDDDDRRGPVANTPGARRPAVLRPGPRPRVREAPERPDIDPTRGQGLRGAGESGGIAIGVDGDVPPTTPVVRRGGRRARGGGEGEEGGQQRRRFFREVRDIEDSKMIAWPKVGRMVDGWVDEWMYGMNG